MQEVVKLNITKQVPNSELTVIRLLPRNVAPYTTEHDNKKHHASSFILPSGKQITSEVSEKCYAKLLQEPDMVGIEPEDHIVLSIDSTGTIVDYKLNFAKLKKKVKDSTPAIAMTSEVVFKIISESGVYSVVLSKAPSNFDKLALDTIRNWLDKRKATRLSKFTAIDGKYFIAEILDNGDECVLGIAKLVTD